MLTHHLNLYPPPSLSAGAPLDAARQDDVTISMITPTQEEHKQRLQEEALLIGRQYRHEAGSG